MKNSWFHIISFKLDKPCVLSGNRRLAYVYRTSEEVVEFSDKLFVAVTKNEYKCDFDSKQSVLFYHLVQKRQILLFYIHTFPQIK